MRVWPLVAARYGWLRGMTGNMPRCYVCREKTPLRTIYNSQTCEFEDMPLSEFQHLLMQGRIQETVRRQPGGPPRRIYLLV